LTQKILYELMHRLKHGRTRLDSEQRSGRHSTSRTDDHRAKVDALIKENITVTVSNDEGKRWPIYAA